MEKEKAADTEKNPGHLRELCEVCQHEDQRKIERDFLNWKSPRKIAKEYGVREFWLRHHADCKDLVKKRRANCLAALDKIVEAGAQEIIKASEVVAAVTAMAKINDEGRWVDKTEAHTTGDLNVHIIDYSNVKGEDNAEEIRSDKG